MKDNPPEKRRLQLYEIRNDAVREGRIEEVKRIEAEMAELAALTLAAGGVYAPNLATPIDLQTPEELFAEKARRELRKKRRLSARLRGRR